MKPWLEWQKNNAQMDDVNLASCPFCASLHRSLNVHADPYSGHFTARVYCRSCNASGPWIVTDERESIASLAKEAWNGNVRKVTTHGVFEVK